MTSPASARGKANRNKGHDTERRLAVYLRQWWPDAARKADTGWRRGDHASADLGDIRGTPGIVWQAKYVQHLNVDKAMSDTFTQTTAAGADYGVLVERRTGFTDPGRWWAWVTVGDIASLTCFPVVVVVSAAPVRLELSTLVALLRHAGYGQPPSVAPTAPETPSPVQGP